jgi:hypothetical protein
MQQGGFMGCLMLALSAVWCSAQELANEAATVMYVQGDAHLERGGQVLVAKKGDVLLVGDRVVTGAGKMQLRFVDGAVVGLNTHSKFQIERYRYSPEKPTDSVAHTRLLEGGLRTVTGAIAKINKPGYQLETVTGLIGVRGTEIMVNGPEVITLAGVVTYAPSGSSASLQGGTGRDKLVVLAAGTGTSLSGSTAAPDHVSQTKPVLEVPVAGPVMVSSLTKTQVDIPAAKESQQSVDISSATATAGDAAGASQQSSLTTVATGGKTLLASSAGMYPLSSGSATFTRTADEVSAQARLVALTGVTEDGSGSGTFDFTSNNSVLGGKTSDQLLSWGTWKANSVTTNQGSFSVYGTGNDSYWLHGLNPVVPAGNGTLSYTSIGYVGDVAVAGSSSAITSLSSTLTLAMGTTSGVGLSLNANMTTASGLTVNFPTTAVSTTQMSGGSFIFNSWVAGGTAYLAGSSSGTNMSMIGSIQFYGAQASQPSYAGLAFRVATDTATAAAGSPTILGNGVVAYKKQ